MAFDGIRLFISTAKHLSITQAAREFHISQSAASRKLNQLEKELKCKLFKPHGRGIELTDSGRSFFEKIVPIMFQLEDATKNIREKSTESISIGACRGPSAILLPSLMARLRETHPSVRLNLYTGNSSEALEWLKASIVDLAVITSPPKSPLFEVEPYRCEPLIAFVAPSHPLAKNNGKARALSDIPLIVRAGGPDRTRTEKELSGLKNERQKLTIAMRCGSSGSVKEAVRTGVGVGILYHDAVKREIDQGEFKRVEIAGLNLLRQSYIVYLKEKPLSAVTRQFLLLLRSSVSEDASIRNISAPIISSGITNTRMRSDLCT